MTVTQQQAAAKKFAAIWAGRGDEKQDTQVFWTSLLRDVYGIARPEELINFEEPVKLDGHTYFIDGHIKATSVLIEQKGKEIDLKKGSLQSDGAILSPYQQARRYGTALPRDEHPRWIVVSNFKEFHIHDMNRPNNEPEIVLLADLEQDYHRMNFLTKVGDEHIQKEMEISLQAGEFVGKLYDLLLKQYNDPASEEELKSLNMLCVRLVFCLYAEDAGIFGSHHMFHDYLKGFQPKNVRKALIDLFKALDTDIPDRDPYMDEDLAAFPYVNGGLFRDENIIIPRFTDEIIDLLLHNASEEFDWSKISPTIFGAVFESTLNPDTRRKGGMHYTSIENIHKLIDPLFLEDLKAEWAAIKNRPNDAWRPRYLRDFRKKLSELTFFDPACGSGNFLTETYLSLRRLENDVILDQYTGVEGQTAMAGMGGEEFLGIQVSIGQFYGIEINDFAATVARTALWIAESQMMKETEAIVHMNLNFLPLKSYANIKEGNALQIDWESVVPKSKLKYIIGNPPFVGARLMDQQQKDDLNQVFGKWKNAGNLDYVSCWYKKAADLIKGTSVRAALVSTNSVCQGESVANLWKPLFDAGLHIDFAYRTFRWDSEAKSKAHVHCIIVGFSAAPNKAQKFICDGGSRIPASNINAYLVDAVNAFVESRAKPLCDVPEIGIGNKPIDGGFYLFEKEEMEEFIRKEPASQKWFMPWYGAQEFINRKPRYCLWLGDCPPNELRKMPLCMERVRAVQNVRMQSKSPGTRKLAETPTRFHVENIPRTECILIPETSSENRRYIPMGFIPPDVLCSNAVRLMPNASLYHFGVLTSNVHMAWMRAVAGRLKSDYRYSKDVVYNNFPWPSPTPAQVAKIEQTAKAILDARALPKYANCSLADLYDEGAMPPELRAAHNKNNRAVWEAYGGAWDITSETACVAALMKLYQDMAK